MDRAEGPIHTPPQTSGMAITSLVLGICSFFCWIFTGLPAVILGALALRNINRSNGRLTGSGLATAGIITGAISTLLVLPIMIALLLPAVHAAREAARRSVAMNNMQQIMLAMHHYADTKGTLPAPGGAEGAASQLSWRVQILPYLEEQALYEQFHLDEPWDSDHNRTLIPRMPAVYKDPADGLPPGETSYLAVTGPGTAFPDADTGSSFRDITDGASNTVVLVEADPDHGVVWTKPDDWNYDPNDPQRGLGQLRHSGFLAGFADAHLSFIDNDTAPDVIKAMMTRDGGEEIEMQE